MKNPDTIYYREWTALSGRQYRLELRCAFPEKGPAYYMDFSYEQFPSRTLLDAGEIETSFEKLPVGMQMTPDLTLKLNLKNMGDDLRDIILKPFPELADFEHEWHPIEDDRFAVPLWPGIELTNTWILTSDRATGDTWYCEFVGIQRKTPGMKFTIDEQSETVEITLMHIARSLMENTLLSIIGEQYFHETFTPPSGAVTTYETTALINLYFTDSGNQFSLQLAPRDQIARMYKLDHLFDSIVHRMNWAVGYYLRSETGSVTLLRKPHENFLLYKDAYSKNHNTGAVLSSGELWFPAFWETQGEYAGPMREPHRDGDESLPAACTNVYNFFSEYASQMQKLMYRAVLDDGNINIEIAFRRVAEKIGSEPTIELQNLSDKQIKFETGSEIIGACNVAIDSMHLKDDDEAGWIVEAPGTTKNESKHEVKVRFHNLPTIPPQEYAEKIETATTLDWYDRSGFIGCNLYYRETALPGRSGEFFVKVHERAGVYMTYQEVQGDGLIEAFPSNYNVRFWGAKSVVGTDADLAWIDLAGGLTYIQRNAGLPATLAKAGAYIFTKPSQTKYPGKSTLWRLPDVIPEAVGDRFNIDPYFTGLAWLPSSAFLMNVKQSIKSGTFDVEFLAVEKE